MPTGYAEQTKDGLILDQQVRTVALERLTAVSLAFPAVLTYAEPF